MSSRKGLSAKTSSGITRPPALQLQQVAASTSGRNVYTLGSTENLDAGIAAAADAAQQNGANPQRR